VVSVNPVEETALTVPSEPPSSLADRALDPPPCGVAVLVGVDVDVDGDEDDDAALAPQPASTSAPAATAALTSTQRRLPCVFMATFLSTWLPSR
jgi:hypothetical protein